MTELGMVWLLMVVLNQNPGPAYISGNLSVESFETKGMSSIQGPAAFDLTPGKERIWAELTTRIEGKTRQRIYIFRFDTGHVYRLDPEKKTYAELPVKDMGKLLEGLQRVYLGGADGKAKARVVPTPQGVTDARRCRQVDAGRYTTIFYEDAGLGNAVTRVDVTSNAENLAVVSKLTGAETKAVAGTKFEIPAGYAKGK